MASKTLASNGTDRRGWDSNPRYGYPYNGFRDRTLGHQAKLQTTAVAGARNSRMPSLRIA